MSINRFNGNHLMKKFNQMKINIKINIKNKIMKNKDNMNKEEHGNLMKLIIIKLVFQWLLVVGDLLSSRREIMVVILTVGFLCF